MRGESFEFGELVWLILDVLLCFVIIFLRITYSIAIVDHKINCRMWTYWCNFETYISKTFLKVAAFVIVALLVWPSIRVHSSIYLVFYMYKFMLCHVNIMIYMYVYTAYLYFCVFFYFHIPPWGIQKVREVLHSLSRLLAYVNSLVVGLLMDPEVLTCPG